MLAYRVHQTSAESSMTLRLRRWTFALPFSAQRCRSARAAVASAITSLEDTSEGGERDINR